nr:immunoglobulin light chain junction region [Macaca mulatta]MOX84113.1 immunoglobulin light chain junction region [Macaca mulatta]
DYYCAIWNSSAHAFF